MKLLRVSLTDDAYSALMAIQGQQQTYTGKRCDLASAVAAALRIAAGALGNECNGMHWMLDLDAEEPFGK